MRTLSHCVAASREGDEEGAAGGEGGGEGGGAGGEERRGRVAGRGGRGRGRGSGRGREAGEGSGAGTARGRGRGSGRGREAGEGSGAGGEGEGETVVAALRIDVPQEQAADQRLINAILIVHALHLFLHRAQQLLDLVLQTIDLLLFEPQQLLMLLPQGHLRHALLLGLPPAGLHFGLQHVHVKPHLPHPEE